MQFLKNIFLFSLLIGALSLKAENPFVRNATPLPPDTLPPNYANLEDLVDDEGPDNGESYELIEDESACAILLCDLYAVWDTTRINPYGIDLRQKKDTTLLQLVYDPECDYAHPIQGSVTSEFGFRRTRWHYGIDIDLETGDEVVAAFEGTIRVARYSPSYGNYVIIRHLNGLETLYAHLSELKVSAGQYVQAGYTIGLGGNTGKSRGSHLHFEVRFQGQQINPRELISFEDFTCSTVELPVHARHFDYLKTADRYKAQMASRKYVTVRSGDTLSKIAKRNGTTVAKICSLNKISAKSKIRPGQRLRLA